VNLHTSWDTFTKLQQDKESFGCCCIIKGACGIDRIQFDLIKITEEDSGGVLKVALCNSPPKIAGPSELRLDVILEL